MASTANSSRLRPTAPCIFRLNAGSHAKFNESFSVKDQNNRASPVLRSPGVFSVASSPPRSPLSGYTTPRPVVATTKSLSSSQGAQSNPNLHDTAGSGGSPLRPRSSKDQLVYPSNPSLHTSPAAAARRPSPLSTQSTPASRWVDQNPNRKSALLSDWAAISHSSNPPPPPAVPSRVVRASAPLQPNPVVQRSSSLLPSGLQTTGAAVLAKPVARIDSDLDATQALFASTAAAPKPTRVRSQPPIPLNTYKSTPHVRSQSQSQVSLPEKHPGKRQSFYNGGLFARTSTASSRSLPQLASKQQLPRRVAEGISEQLRNLHLCSRGPGCSTCLQRDYYSLALVCKTWGRAANRYL
jgi:hypothetical protein